MTEGGIEDPNLNPVLGKIFIIVGFVLHLGAGFVYIVSGLVVPALYLPVLWLIWVALLAWAIWQRNHPWRVLATPVMAAILWFVFVQGLGSLLDWTA